MKTISANEKLDAIIASVEKSGLKAAKLIENLNKNEGKELNIRVDTETMGDPAHGMRKFLVMMIRIGENIYRITYNEGFNVGLKFN